MTSTETPISNIDNDHERRLVCGYPKTGRTWLRFMIANALSNEYDLGLDVDLNNVYSIVPNEQIATLDGQPNFQYQGVIPKIEMSHRPYQTEFRGASLIFMTRDPRDIMVSHWLHDKLQVGLFNGNLSEYIKSPQRGISAFMSHLESWSSNLQTQKVVTYETMRSSPIATVSRIFEKLGVEVSGNSIEFAVAQGDINRMRKIEVNSGIAGHDYDRTNPEARRVRSGKIGGYIHYLTQDDLEYIGYAVDGASEAARQIISMTPYPIDQE